MCRLLPVERLGSCIKMDRRFETVKSYVVNFKLDFCCWFFPVRFGLFFIGYFNVCYSVISLIGMTDDSFLPILIKIQNPDEDPKKPIPVLAYAVELAFNVVLLCGLYQRDVTLMWVFVRYCLVSIITDIMVYSLVAALGVWTTVAMVINILLQLYTLLLVQSTIVDYRMIRKRQKVEQSILMSTLNDRFKKDVIVDFEPPNTRTTVIDKPGYKNIIVENPAKPVIIRAENDAIVAGKQTTEIEATEDKQKDDVKTQKEGKATILKPTKWALVIRKPKNKAIENEKSEKKAIENEKSEKMAIENEKSEKKAIGDKRSKKETIVFKPEKKPTEDERHEKSAAEVEKPVKRTIKFGKPEETLIEVKNPEKKVTEIKKLDKTSIEFEKPEQKATEMKKPENKALKIEKPEKEAEKSDKKTIDVEKPEIVATDVDKVDKLEINVETTKPLNAETSETGKKEETSLETVNERPKRKVFSFFKSK